MTKDVVDFWESPAILKCLKNTDFKLPLEKQTFGNSC